MQRTEVVGMIGFWKACTLKWDIMHKCKKDYNVIRTTSLNAFIYKVSLIILSLVTWLLFTWPIDECIMYFYMHIVYANIDRLELCFYF